MAKSSFSAMSPIKKLAVAILPKLLNPNHAGTQQAAVVIDTLRFTTTAAQAIQSGARSIRVAQEIAAARALASSLGGSVRLCGERECRPIEGFHFGNSPLEYTTDAVSGHELIFSTTNGTRAVEATRDNVCCLLGALVNRSAVAKAITTSEVGEWQIACAGTDGQVAGEDLLAAGAILESLMEYSRVELLNDSARLALTLWRSIWSGNQDLLATALESFSGGQNLVQSGYSADIQFAAKVDTVDAVPMRNKDDLVFIKWGA